MKIFQSSIFRAICAIVVGALLIKYPEDGVTWLTVAIGVLFLLSGIIAVIERIYDYRSGRTNFFQHTAYLPYRRSRQHHSGIDTGLNPRRLHSWLDVYSGSHHDIRRPEPADGIDFRPQTG